MEGAWTQHARMGPGGKVLYVPMSVGAVQVEIS
jgi:hypothetical protein